MKRHPDWVFVSLLVFAGLIACSSPAPPPTPTALPPTPTSAPTVYPTLDAITSDTQDAFLTNVNDLTSEIETLAMTQCAELTTEIRANPTAVSQIHGFATSLQRAGTAQPALNTSADVRSSLNDLTRALSQFDSALSKCGIQSP